MRQAASVSDYRALAKARLPHFLFEYLDGGSYDEVTLRRNVEDLRSVALQQRVLRDVSQIDLSTELLGKRWAMPVGLGPVGLSGLYARRGEVQAARAAWLWDVGIRGRPISLGNLEPIVGQRAPLGDFQRWIHDNFDASVTWKDVEWVRDQWKGPLIIKGILDPGDAREAVANGADGLVVSNHGGRQLDGALSSARALPAVGEAVGGKIPVLADGGVRSGLDVVRMLALGADFVLLGRT